MKFDIITIFPGLFDSFLNESLINKSISSGIIDITLHNPRDFTTDKHQQVDDRPFGGGPGMVLMIDPIYKALSYIKETALAGTKTILLSPTGSQFSQEKAEELSSTEQLIFISGRYEGVDARIDQFVDEKISIGPFITNGGELPAMIMIETIARLLPGFIGNPDSLKPHISEKTSVIPEKHEYPVYSRPEIYVTPEGQELSVPKELLSGDHALIKKWREDHKA